MPPRKPTDAGPATEDRATDYGDRATQAADRATESGDRATKTPAAPAPAAPGTPPATTTPPLPKPRVAEIIVIDPHPPGPLMTDEVRDKSLPQVEQDLNRLYMSTPGKETLKKGEGVTFSVAWRRTATSKAERAAFSALQYPVHILVGHASNRTSTDAIENLMKDHGISNAGRKEDIFQMARDGWDDTSVEGLGIPPWIRPQKVGFIKADNIYKARGDFVTLFRNIILHELGHMFGQNHGDGVMKRAIVLADASLFYSEDQQTAIRANLRGMVMRQIAEEQAAERAAKAKQGP
jgi:hypothetical protein